MVTSSDCDIYSIMVFVLFKHVIFNFIQTLAFHVKELPYQIF